MLKLFSVVQFKCQKLSAGIRMNIAMSSFKIVQLRQEDEPKVCSFMRKYFLRDEPLNVAINLSDEEKSNEDVLKYSCTALNEGYSIAALAGSGEMIGICLNEVIKREEQKTAEEHSSVERKFDRILTILEYLEKNADMFGRYPEIHKILDVKIISVDESYRGQGVCKALIGKTKELAKQAGIPLVKVDCTSAFTAKAAEKLGFHCIYSLVYKDFLDDAGKPVILPSPPHTCATVYVMEIK